VLIMPKLRIPNSVQSPAMIATTTVSYITISYIY
jgi:hypothetical protein